MKVEIKHCNNIDSGSIEIKQNNLNIKYAINGTGKSTIAKAIFAAISDRDKKTQELNFLTQFKSIKTQNNLPLVTGVDEIKSMRTFDEKYINEFVFRPDELLKGSFDIFIRDETYDKGMLEIDNLVETMQNTLSKDPEIEILKNDFSEISGSFGKPTKGGGLHGSSNLAKAFKDGNKILNIPEGLESYKTYIQHPENYKWLKWQLDGKSYLDISEECPYCITNIKTKKETIRKVGTVYEPKSVENLNKIVAAFHRLSMYFSDATKKKIDEFVKNIDGYTDEQIAFLQEIKEQIDRLKVKFEEAQNIGFQSFKDIEKLEKLMEGLKTHKIDIELYSHLRSANTSTKVSIVNNAIDILLEKAGLLQGSIVRQRTHIEKLIKIYSAEINSFLKNAGLSYEVILLEDETAQHKLKLKHRDISTEIKNVSNHLSFGERNAFSLVLFMYDVLKDPVDLIVLDDPISSFDKNKKYAIIDMLFRDGKSFRDKTVLLLTHDFEPIVDMVYHHRDRFSLPYATFVENKHGQISEKEVKKENIKTFLEINKLNLNQPIHVLNKLIYLRRHYEVIGSRTHAYDIISSLLHKRPHPTKLALGVESPLSADERRDGIAEIVESIAGFDYDQILALITNLNEIKKLYLGSGNNYEKLHLYRILFDGNADGIESEIILKFINQSFHIENDYVYQLNPREYSVVPQYVIDECDKYVTNVGIAQTP